MNYLAKSNLSANLSGNPKRKSLISKPYGQGVFFRGIRDLNHRKIWGMPQDLVGINSRIHNEYYPKGKFSFWDRLFLICYFYAEVLYSILWNYELNYNYPQKLGTLRR